MAMAVCGPSGPHLGLDQACLRIDAPPSTGIFTVSSECYSCSPRKVWSNDEAFGGSASASIIVNSTWPTIFTVARDPSGDDLCNFRYAFNEFGLYQMDVTPSSTPRCTISVIREGNSALWPTIWALLILLALKVIWHCIVKFYESRTFRRAWISLRFDLSREVNEDLLEDTSGLIPVIPEASGHNEASQIDQNRQASLRSRLKSLDTFRGISIALMIFVNYGGGQYRYFKHSPWNGLTVADLVFPWFMWIMGVSLALSMQSQLRRSVLRKIICLRVLKRVVILFFFGLFVNSHGKADIRNLRIPGVLQRFAIVYFVTAMIEARFMSRDFPDWSSSWRRFVTDVLQNATQWLMVALAIGIHVAVTFFMPVPGCPTGYIGPGGLHHGGQFENCTGGAARIIDVSFFGEAHIYQRSTAQRVYETRVPFDPEGLLGILTSLLIVVLGLQGGKTIVAFPRCRDRIIRWILWAIVTGLAAGLLCGFTKEEGLIPVNKNLWSVSFVLATSSMAFTLFVILYFLVDYVEWWTGSPFSYAGMNSILLYVGHEVCKGYFPFAWRPISRGHIGFLFMNLWGTSLWLLIAYVLHLKRLYFAV